MASLQRIMTGKYSAPATEPGGNGPSLQRIMTGKCSAPATESGGNDLTTEDYEFMTGKHSSLSKSDT